MTVPPLHIPCPRGCGATLTVQRPPPEPLPQVPDPDKRSPYPSPHERRMFEAVGRVLCETLLAHALFDCPAFDAEDQDCGHQQGGRVCNLTAGHTTRHEVLEYLEDENRVVAVAWWANLQVAP